MSRNSGPRPDKAEASLASLAGIDEQAVAEVAVVREYIKLLRDEAARWRRAARDAGVKRADVFEGDPPE